MLCSKVIALKSVVRVESARGWLENKNQNPEGRSSQAGRSGH